MSGTLETDGLGTDAMCCIVCGGTSDDVVLRDNGFEGRACACGTIYTSPRPKPGEVDHTLVGHDDAFYDLAAALKARWIRRHARGATLLEVGCGAGAFLLQAQRTGYSVEGVEPDGARAAVARIKTASPIHERFLAEFSCDQRFDVVAHFDMLAHFPDPRAALTDMSALLSNSGVLAFEVGLIGGTPRFWYRGLDPIGYPQHRWLYSEASLRTLLQQAGLRIRRSARFDLSACVALTLGLRRLARLRNALLPGRATRDSNVQTPPTISRSAQPLKPRARAVAYEQLQNFLRYRVGAVLPSIGPGTLLIVAERC